MQCQYLYDCDPGESHARPCPDKTTATAEFTYRHGEAKSTMSMCAYHAKLSTDNLNGWGKPYGHSAQVLPLVVLVTIWFSHCRGPYPITEDRFDSVEAAEAFWEHDPFFISAELPGECPPVAIEHNSLHRYEAQRGISRAKGSRHTASLLNGSYAHELGRFE